MYGGKEITDAEARQIHKGPMAAQRAENKPDPVSNENKCYFSINHNGNVTTISIQLFGIMFITYQN